MTDSDPFSDFEHDRTVIKPSAGRAMPPTQSSLPGASVAPAPPASEVSGASPLPNLLAGTGLSLLMQLSSPLLVTSARLRVMPHHANLPALRAALVEAVREFESSARSQGLPNDQVIAGRYLICTFIDECASSTPWGGSGIWSSQSLLVLFHNESWGGEKLFQLLAKLAENPAANRSLLELIYAILALGFEGRYRVLPDGRSQLEGMREKLALMLRQGSASALQDLSPRWQGVPAAGRRLSDGIPVWLVALATALLLGLVFLALRLSIAYRSDDVFTDLQALDVKAAAAAVVPDVPAAAPRLSTFLKAEIESGAVEVRDFADRSVIVIRGDGFFEPASAEVSGAVLPLMGRIGAELARVPGSVLVTGHTDNQAIRSLRYPSNWHLSEARARAVKEILEVNVKADRIRFEGLADTQPVGDNATATGRARNRRVEITLTLAQSGATD